MIFQEEGREWRFPGLLYAGDLIFCGESKEDLRAVVGRFLEVCRRRDLKVNAGKSKVYYFYFKVCFYFTVVCLIA